ncbi:hypothetical protein JW835_09320 [bacterium]|nr:hypothetical protein [bacterium]
MTHVKHPLVIIMIILVVCFISSDPIRAQENVFGLDIGIVFSGEDLIYLDDPIDTWVDRESGPILSGQYYRKLSPTFMVGGYAEYEALNTEGDDGSRIGFGLTYIGRYPGDLSNGLGFELGGTLGFTFANLGDLDSQSGIDFGILLGPVMQISPNMQLAIHLNALYGWYSGGDVPEGVQNNRPPALKLQIYRSF